MITSFQFPFSFVKNPFHAIGGIITQVGPYTIHTFATSGTFQILAGTKNIDYLVVAGGGGTNSGSGASATYNPGGAGGLLASTQNITIGSYSVTVGSGGAFAITTLANGSNGGNSIINFPTIVTAIGGGGGGGYGSAGSSGGSGGTGDQNNAGGTGTVGQGYAGTSYYSSGGAGGAGGMATGAEGGPGVSSSISGTSVIYATGGSTDGGSRLATNYGDGGSFAGGTPEAGKPGIVIIRYLT